MALLWVTAKGDHCLRNYPGTCRDEMLSVDALMKHARPAATYPDKVSEYADQMRRGGWDYEDSDEPIHLAHTPEGSVLIDGNHRILAAHEAGITHLPVHVKTIYGAEGSVPPDLRGEPL